MLITQQVADLVVVYVRVSSDEQAEKDLSIPAQLKALRRWADQNGLTIVKEFVDEGESAYSPANKRPGFCKMMTFVKKKKIRYILVHKLDRFSRNRDESVIFKGLLRQVGITVKSISEDYDPETPMGFLYEGIIEVINQFYSMNLSMETLKGMKENAERGGFNGGVPPYGYRVRTLNENGRQVSGLAPGPDEEVETVRSMFFMAAEYGLGSKTIARELNRRKIPSPRARGWNPGSVNTILNNPVYVGDTAWGKHRLLNREQRRVVPKEEWIVVPDTHEALVPRDHYERWRSLTVQRQFVTPGSREGHAEFLLGRLIHCGHCGANFKGREQKYKTRKGEPRSRRQYYCSSYLRMGAEICRSLPLHADWADGVILKVLQKHLCSTGALAELERRSREALASKIRMYAGNARDLEKQLADCDRRIRNFYRAIGDGLDPSICRQHIADQVARKEELQRKADLAEREDLHKQAIEATVAEVRRFGEVFRSGFQSLPMPLQQRIVRYFVEKIEILDRKKFRVTLRVPMDAGSEIKSLTVEDSGGENGNHGMELGGSGHGDSGVFTRGGRGGAGTCRPPKRNPFYPGSFLSISHPRRRAGELVTR